VATSGSDRNWKGMFISTLVIVTVMGFIVLSVVLLKNPEGETHHRRRMSFGDFLSDNFSANAFNATWISGTCTSLR
jgi:hypothetical protein